MTTYYNHVNVTLTEDEIRERVESLAATLNLSKGGTLSPELAWALTHDVQVVHSMEQVGVNLDKPRVIEQWAVFPTAKHAKRFARSVRTHRKGFKCKVVQVRDGAWSVTMHTLSDVRMETIARMTTSLLLLAQAYGGTYDGFEVTVDRREAMTPDLLGEGFTADELADTFIPLRPGFEPQPNNRRN